MKETGRYTGLRKGRFCSLRKNGFGKVAIAIIYYGAVRLGKNRLAKTDWENEHWDNLAVGISDWKKFPEMSAITL